MLNSYSNYNMVTFMSESEEVVTFLCLNMEKAKERITDPKNPISTSPAPGLEDAIVR